MSTLRFLSDWSQKQIGDIRPGTPLRIEYDGQRLPHCRSERYGRPAWNIAAYLRFHPGGETQSGAVSGGALDVDVPGDATRIELWFHNSDQTGCSTWDSNYGQNYWVEIPNGDLPAPTGAAGPV